MKNFMSRITRLSRAGARQVRKLSILAVMALLFFCPIHLQVLAAASDLDLTFGSGGKVTTDLFGNSDFANALAIQSDGKIVVAGDTFNENTFFDFAVTRYNADGSLDTSFGIGGKATTTFSQFNEDVNAIAIQTDGKIVLAGGAPNDSTGSFEFALARYNSDGTLDSTFGSGGKVTTNFFDAIDFALAVVIQSDGKIVAAGSTFTAGEAQDFAIARYNPDGSLDTTFDLDGKVTTNFSDSSDEVAALVIQPDGKIVAAGVAIVSVTALDFALARYNSDGTLDSTFGSGGKVTTDFGDLEEINALALQPDGKLTAAGAVFVFGPSDFALARYNSNGTLDTSFGTGGKVTSDLGSDEEVRAVAIQPNGKIIAAGGVKTPLPTNDFALARYDSDGTPDLTFGTGGKLLTDFFGQEDAANAMALQQDGKIVVAGFALSDAGFDFALARYIGDGQNQGGTFDICLQDESNVNLLQFNSTTGDYQFTDCRKGLILTGRGTVRIRFCKIEFSASKPDHSITALANTCTKAGSTSVKLLPSGRIFTISDRDMSNNTCTCR